MEVYGAFVGGSVGVQFNVQAASPARHQAAARPEHALTPPGPTAVDEALDAVAELVHDEPIVLHYGDADREDDERDYFRFHRPRFRETLRRMVRRLPQGASILDVGSHFLHLALALRRLGYAVSAVDVPLYACHPRIVARAGSGLTLDPIESLASLPLGAAAVDGIAFLEILEHLAINPKGMWGELGRILKPDGTLFLTTPNFYRLGGGGGGFLEALRFLRGDGAGVPVPQILADQTGGHHWKEYSLRELRRYFDLLGWRITAADRFNYLPMQRRWLRLVKPWVPAIWDCHYLELARG